MTGTNPAFQAPPPLIKEQVANVILLFGQIVFLADDAVLMMRAAYFAQWRRQIITPQFKAAAGK